MPAAPLAHGPAHTRIFMFAVVTALAHIVFAMHKPLSYRVCLVAPPGYPHARAFMETAFLLKASLASLGFSCDIAINQISSDSLNIVLGAHLLKDADVLASGRCAVYQLEQLGARRGPVSERYLSLLQRAAAVWDYSCENIAYLSSKGIRALHLPLGYHPHLEQIPRGGSGDCDVDVLFYGSMCPRRKEVLDSLAAPGDLRIRSLFGVYGKERDELIGRSRIVLNIHYYDTRIFEAVRISYLLNNRCFVVSEDSSIYPYDGVELVVAPRKRLADLCRRYLASPPEIGALAEKTYRQFKTRYPMTSALKSVLDSMGDAGSSGGAGSRPS